MVMARAIHALSLARASRRRWPGHLARTRAV